MWVCVFVWLCFCFCVFVFVFVSVFVCVTSSILPRATAGMQNTLYIRLFIIVGTLSTRRGATLEMHNVTRTFAQPLNCRTQSEQDIESQLKHPVQCAGQLLGLKSACRHSFNAIDTPNSCASSQSGVHSKI